MFIWYNMSLDWRSLLIWHILCLCICRRIFIHHPNFPSAHWNQVGWVFFQHLVHLSLTGQKSDMIKWWLHIGLAQNVQQPPFWDCGQLCYYWKARTVWHSWAQKSHLLIRICPFKRRRFYRQPTLGGRVLPANKHFILVEQWHVSSHDKTT